MSEKSDLTTRIGSAGIDRRSFLKSGTLSTAALVAGLGPIRRSFAQPVGSPDHHVPIDKQLTPEWLELLTAKGERKVFRGAERETIG